MRNRTVCALFLAAAALLSGGCYQKTVAASGFGADKVSIDRSDPGSSERVLGYPKSSYRPLPTTH